jgi:hypothetical protein
LSNPKWDAFICHASEDKDQVATPLAKNLTNLGLNIWYDEFTLKVILIVAVYLENVVMIVIIVLTTQP